MTKIKKCGKRVWRVLLSRGGHWSVVKRAGSQAGRQAGR